MRRKQGRFESNLHYWRDRRKGFTVPVVVHTSNNINPKRVDHNKYGHFLSVVFERGRPRYFMFEGQDNAQAFVDDYQDNKPPPLHLRGSSAMKIKWRTGCRNSRNIRSQ